MLRSSCESFINAVTCRRWSTSKTSKVDLKRPRGGESRSDPAARFGDGFGLRANDNRRQEPFSPSATARMCSTPTPQQPPTIAAPASTQRLASARYTSGDTWSTKAQFGRVQ